jgi:putative membrane protein
MKKVINALLILVIMLCFAACRGRDSNGSSDDNNMSGSKKNTDSTRGAPEANATPAQQTRPADQESINFVTKAASGGMLEVQLGQLAQQKAKSQRVKDFGGMMVTDHSKANDELKGLAASQNVIIQTSLLPEHQKHLDMMTKMSGADFDKHYMDMMVSDHKEDINEFKKESNNSKNEAFKSFAAKTLPVLQKHLDSAQAIHSKM